MTRHRRGWLAGAADGSCRGSAPRPRGARLSQCMSQPVEVDRVTAEAPRRVERRDRCRIFRGRVHDTRARAVIPRGAPLNKDRWKGTLRRRYARSAPSVNHARALVVAVLLSTASLARAQSTTGSISGGVTDTSSASLTGATITVTSEGRAPRERRPPTRAACITSSICRLARIASSSSGQGSRRHRGRTCWSTWAPTSASI
jgi:hypothetical protein